MKFLNTKIEGLWIIELELRSDERGYFVRSFCEKEFKDQGIHFQIKQINRSLNTQAGTIRGMHFQTPPKAEAKVVTVLKGKVFDVAVDVRPGSVTYGQWEGVELSEENKRLFYIPKGFAHGYQTLVPNCELQYLMDEFYSAEQGSGVRYNDPAFGIIWPLANPMLSDKDRVWPLVNTAVKIETEQ